MHVEMGLVLSEAIVSVKNLLKNDKFPNYTKVTLEKHIATSDAEKNENGYISNQKVDEYSDDSSDDLKITIIHFSWKKKQHLPTLKLIIQLYKTR
jgi:hypothetical protein